MFLLIARLRFIMFCMTDSIILPVEAHQWVKSLFESLDRMHREGADHEQLANYVQRSEPLKQNPFLLSWMKRSATLSTR